MPTEKNHSNVGQITYIHSKAIYLEVHTRWAVKPLGLTCMKVKYDLSVCVIMNDSDPSLIYYLQLLDENADSLETMAQVSELVLEKLLSDSLVPPL